MKPAKKNSPPEEAIPSTFIIKKKAKDLDVQDASLPNNSNNKEGLGSNYGGTTSPNPNAPDGYQHADGENKPEDKLEEKDGELGSEYDSASSYGE